MKNTIKFHRINKSLTQLQLAKLCGTSQQQIQRVEAGSHGIRIELAVQICRALDLSLGDVFPDVVRVSRGFARKRDFDYKTMYENSKQKSLEDIGFDMSAAIRTALVSFKSGITRQYKITNTDSRRLHSHLCGVDSSPFFTFRSSSKTIVINIKQTSVVRLLEDYMIIDMKTDEEIEEARQVVQVHLVGQAEPDLFDIDPDELVENGSGVLMDSSGDLGQFQHLELMFLEGFEGESHIYFVDEDDEPVFINIDDICYLEFPIPGLDLNAFEENNSEADKLK